MVVDYRSELGDELDDEQVDRMFRALADATRRDIVTEVMRSERSVSELAARYPMSFAAVQKHVAVLERAGLVSKRRHGREQLVSGEIDRIARLHRVLDQFEAVWRHRFDRIGDLLADEREGNPHARDRRTP